MDVVLAHQGGWDEALLVVGPLLAFGGLLAMAYLRGEDADPPDDVDDEGGEDSPLSDPADTTTGGFEHQQEGRARG